MVNFLYFIPPNTMLWNCKLGKYINTCSIGCTVGLDHP
jgi:hypothetical protein